MQQCVSTEVVFTYFHWENQQQHGIRSDVHPNFCTHLYITIQDLRTQTPPWKNRPVGFHCSLFFVFLFVVFAFWFWFRCSNIIGFVDLLTRVEIIQDIINIMLIVGIYRFEFFIHINFNFCIIDEMLSSNISIQIKYIPNICIVDIYCCIL